ncbi:TIGR03619 family F420-dependent LLM class oxidoreductase [Amycolatopsis sp. DSM 110486]|uniref:TIGR03619 family F420-dependent LLM class oxidoreductase n=1 Tax=Amycolatopsis sp. DSM 110486 TaxID=2865832 RepID=UPI001C6A5038|nr:TIGR03619 family F420-dependent LLM class oxidoreductase [Amycolatopsis sp. DSM 110486]QYN23283.1 TIGR03619 family F420-dependent LLM class oxidoreductase [Amycolatopsis sp. DSM 110486]
MQFAVSYNPAFHGLGGLVAFARHAETCGFEGLLLPEHLASRPGVKLGGWEIPPTLPYADPLECLAHVAAVTDRLLLGTGVLLLPYHQPVALAKRLATLDVLSGGRLRLVTVGVGALPHEASAAGVDYRTRGRRADEALDVLRLLWTGGPEGVGHHGEFVEFDDLCSYPKPVGTIPIRVGGSSHAAARRAGLRGDGWFPGGSLTPDDRVALFDLVRATAEKAGRRTPDYTRWGSTELTSEGIDALAAEGVTRVVVSAGSADPQERLDELSAFAERFALHA